jgi:hypothetical protein
MRFVGIVSDVFLDDPGGLNSCYSMRQTGHPVFCRDTEQFLMHSEAICEALYPSQAGSIVVDPDWVVAPFTTYF